MANTTHGVIVVRMWKNDGELEARITVDMDTEHGKFGQVSAQGVDGIAAAVRDGLTAFDTSA